MACSSGLARPTTGAADVPCRALANSWFSLVSKSSADSAYERDSSPCGVTPAFALLMALAFSSTGRAESQAQNPATATSAGATAARRDRCTSNPGERMCARPIRRAASRSCDRPARRRASSARRGATTTPASGYRTAVRGGVRRRTGACSGSARRGEEAARARAERRLPALSTARKGEIYIRLFSYVRYLNQTESRRDLHRRVRQQARPSSSGRTSSSQKFFSPFSGWFLTPKFRVLPVRLVVERVARRSRAGRRRRQYQLHVQPVRHRRRRHHVPADASGAPKGQFPYWLGVDDRLIADEFFRGSYTNGVWLKGEIATKLKYKAMLANNLSTLGVSAAQIDNKIDTQSYMLQWLPTTGEFGLSGTFGDYDYHEKLATRLAVHYTQSTEDKQSQPGTERASRTARSA